MMQEEGLNFSNKNNIDQFIGQDTSHSPNTNPNPFINDLTSKVTASLQRIINKSQQVIAGFPPQSLETGKHLTYNKRAAKQLLLNLFQKACRNGTPLQHHPSYPRVIQRNPPSDVENPASSSISQVNNSFPQSFQDGKLLSDGRFPNRFRIHDRSKNRNNEQTKQFEKHPPLFFAIGQNLSLLLDYLQGKDFTHVMPFELNEYPLNEAALDSRKRWMKKGKCKIFSNQYTILMKTGDNYNAKDPKAPFQITDYLGKQQNKNAAVDYFLQVCRGMSQLVKLKIYHMDLSYANIIPVREEDKIIYKIMDFQYSLFLDRTFPKIRENLLNLWQELSTCWKNNKGLVNYVFSSTFFRHRPIFACNRAPNEELLEFFLTESENQGNFVNYLLKYMQDCYRNDLLFILKEIKNKNQWLADHSKRLEEIIECPSSNFRDILHKVEQLWSNRK